jgi:hypothetical protein
VPAAALSLELALAVMKNHGRVRVRMWAATDYTAAGDVSPSFASSLKLFDKVTVLQQRRLANSDAPVVPALLFGVTIIQQS